MSVKESKKKAITSFHRTNIIKAAEKLFLEKGIESTTVDDIAKSSEYSKATLYVYFKNKEEIISSITLSAMEMFYITIQKAIASSGSFQNKYFTVCNAITGYQQQYPFHFESILKEINIDIELEKTPQVYREIFEVGEKMNREFYALFSFGMEEGFIRKDLNILKTVFLFWASISGIIRIANQKERYLSKCIGVSKDDFLQFSFDTLLHSIKAYERT